MRLFSCSMSIILAIVAPAFASGGFSCTGDDEKAKFLIEAGVTRGMGGPVFNFRGDVEIADATVRQDLRKQEFGPENLPQYWLDGKDLRLLVYRERENDKPHGYVELTILTQVSEEGVYGGQYAMKVYDTGKETDPEGKTWEIAGTVSCFVE